MSGSRFNYVIPLYQGLEAVLGASLEIQLDLSSSGRLHRTYEAIAKNHRVESLLPIPRSVIPLDLKLGFERQRYKTVVTAQEVSLSQQKCDLEQSYVDVSFEKEKESYLRLQ